MNRPETNELLKLLENSLTIDDGKAIINNRPRLQSTIYRLAEESALGSGINQGLARYITRLAALAFGVYPASIQDLYLARGRGELPYTFTVPALNLRMLSFDAARAVFRVAKSIDGAAFIFEIARSEMGYTDQRPAEYVTSILAAAISEGYTGPVFIQGDHFQVSAKRYASAPDAEIQAVRDLIREAIGAGFFNIDIDTSTLVDISKPTVTEQQVLNCSLSAMFTAYIRKHQSEGVNISIGGEIGEVGGHNSTEEELRAYMDGYNKELARLMTGAAGLSKISIQTGTSHGGVVLPDGSIAQVAVDFGALLKLSRVGRSAYGIGGAVQHGASTLPEDAFGKFVESEAIEVHLATNFQNITYDLLPEKLKADMYKYLDEKSASERKPDMTDEQFYYKTRKNAIGPFKAQTWNMDTQAKEAITTALEAQFRKLFSHLGVSGTRKFVEKTIKPVAVTPNIKFYLGEDIGEENVSDLAD
jgi:fructose/tagatose bisphosphate aldolase